MRERVRSILVVLDDDMVAAAVTEALVRAGHEVERKRHGPEVAARLSGHDTGLPDLLVAGAPAPEEGGLDTLRSLLEALAHRVQAVLLTADDTPEWQEDMRRLGACAILPVDVPSADLVEQVRTALRKA